MQKLVLISVPKESRPQESAALLTLCPLGHKAHDLWGTHKKYRFLSPTAVLLSQTL